MIPGGFYCFICSTYIANAKIGFNIPWTYAYIIGVVAAVAYVGVIIWYGRKARRRPYPPALIQHWILFRSGPVSGSAPLHLPALVCRSGLWYDTSPADSFLR